MKKLILALSVLISVFTTLNSQQQVLTVADFNGEVPANWRIVSNNKSSVQNLWHQSGALLIGSDKNIILSPELEASNSVSVDLYISSFFFNKKTSKADTLFFIYALNSDSAVLDTKIVYSSSIKAPGHYTVKLSGKEDVAFIKIVSNPLPRFNGVSNNVAVQSLKISSVEADNNNSALNYSLSVSVTEDILYTNIPDNEYYEIFSITGARMKKGYSSYNKINISDLNKGIYIIRTAAGAAKFIVK